MPEYDVYCTTLSPTPESLKEHRIIFIYRILMKPFKPENISKPHSKVFQELRESIEKGEIWHLYQYLGEGISFFLKPIDVVLWACVEGIRSLKRFRKHLD